MRAFFRGCLAVAVLGFTVVISGCAEDNEKTANITGRAPDGGGPTSQAELKKDMRGGGGSLPKNYPGAAKRN